MAAPLALKTVISNPRTATKDWSDGAKLTMSVREMRAFVQAITSVVLNPCTAKKIKAEAAGLKRGRGKFRLSLKDFKGIQEAFEHEDEGTVQVMAAAAGIGAAAIAGAIIVVVILADGILAFEVGSHVNV